MSLQDLREFNAWKLQLLLCMEIVSVIYTYVTNSLLLYFISFQSDKGELLSYSDGIIYLYTRIRKNIMIKNKAIRKFYKFIKMKPSKLDKIEIKDIKEYLAIFFSQSNNIIHFVLFCT